MDAISAPLPTQNASLTLPKRDGRIGRKKSPEELAKFAKAREIRHAQQRARARLKNLDEAKAEEELRKLILDASKDLFRHAMIPAVGCVYVYRVDKIKGDKGKEIEKHVLVEDPHEIASALDQISAHDFDEEYYYITKEKPDFRAIEMLWNRGIGRPSENKKVDITKRTYSLVEIAQRAEERARVHTQ